MNEFIKEEVTIDGSYPLEGTLLVPKGKGPFPAVLLVAGSGLIDRNGNIRKTNLATNIYKELAEYISGLGFITLRVDKRGVGSSGGNYLETGMLDLIDDLKSNISFLKSRPEVDTEKIILLGHSEGCILSTALSNKCKVGGLILLSGAAETLKQALKRQREISVGEMLQLKGFQGKLARFMKVDKRAEKSAEDFADKIIASNDDIIKINGFVKVNAKWYREHFNYNVTDDLQKVECPVLAITGSKDFQADPKKVENIPGLVKGSAEYHIIEGMNHILKEKKGQISAINYKKEYRKSACEPIHNELVKLLSRWLLKEFKS